MFRHNIEYLKAQQKQIKEDNARLSGIDRPTKTNERGVPLPRQVHEVNDDSDSMEEVVEEVEVINIEQDNNNNTTVANKNEENEASPIVSMYHKIYNEAFKKQTRNEVANNVARRRRQDNDKYGQEANCHYHRVGSHVSSSFFFLLL